MSLQVRVADLADEVDLSRSAIVDGLLEALFADIDAGRVVHYTGAMNAFVRRLIGRANSLTAEGAALHRTIATDEAAL